MLSNPKFVDIRENARKRRLKKLEQVSMEIDTYQKNIKALKKNSRKGFDCALDPLMM